MKNLFALTLLLLSLDGLATGCFKDLEEEELAILKLKAQVICAEGGLTECKEILLAKPPKLIEQEQSPACEAESSTSSLLPLRVATFELLEIQEHLVDGRKKYVNSVVDFYHHTKLHKKRVKTLALKALEKFPEEFEGISKEMAARVMEHHDDAKVNLVHRSKAGKPFFEELFKHYGNKAPREIVDQLNAADGKVMERMMAREGLAVKPTDSAVQQARKLKIRKNLLKLEKLADFTDRGLNPVTAEEFGRKTWLESVAAKKSGDSKLAKMAMYLEKNYKKFTKGLMYHKLPAKQYYKLSQKISSYAKFGKLLSRGRSLKEISIRSMEGLSKAAAKVRHFIPGPSGLDMATLLLTPTDTACSADPGFHDWTTKAGKCVPQMGLTPKFISFINLPQEERRKQYGFGKYMCPLTKENLKLNEASIFTNISCSQGGARMQVAHNDYIDLKFNSEGTISEMNLDKFKMSFGFFTRTPSRIVMKNGMPTKECFKKKCEDLEKGKLSSFLEKFSSLNYMIYRGVGCCLGVKNEFSESVKCNRPL